MSEARNLPKYSGPILALMEREDEMITAADIAPIVRMKEDTIIKYAKNGQWPREVYNYIVSGNRVKFFRVDFLRKCNWLESRKENPAGAATPTGERMDKHGKDHPDQF